MRTVEVEERIILAVKTMCENAKSRVRLNAQFSDEFNIKVGVHLGAVLSPILYIIITQALSREFKVDTQMIWC